MIFTNRKVGGIRFMRIGRLQMSFCMVKAAAPKAAPIAPTYDQSRAASAYATDMLRPIYGASLNLCSISAREWQRLYDHKLSEFTRA